MNTIEQKNNIQLLAIGIGHDVKRYYKASLGDRARAEARITQIVKDELKNQFGIRTIQQAISGERDEIMSTLEVKSQALADQLGIKLVDVRISRIELPTQVSDSVYERMRAERSRTAKDFRARGQEMAEKIVDAEPSWISFSFDGNIIETIESNSNGYFENSYLVPDESIAGPNTIMVTYIPDEFYLSSTSSWVLQVSHNIRIELPDYFSMTNTTESISGFVFDKADRPVSSLEVRLTLDSGFPLITNTNSEGEFSVDLEIPYGTSLGYHNLTAESLGNNYYIGNSTTSKLFVQGQTFLTLDVPASLEFKQEFTGTITLQMYDGTYVSGAPLLISFEPLGMTTMVVTDYNGTATFSSYYSGNTTIPMQVTVNYTGNEEYVASSIESTIIYRACLLYTSDAADE